MGDYLAFFVPACGFIFVIRGAWELYYAFRTRSVVDPAGEPGSGTLVAVEAVEANVRTRLRAERIGGIFWLCLGMATFWFSDFRSPWILSSIGIFWMVVAVSRLYCSFRPDKQAVLAAEVYAESATASHVNGRKPLLGKPLRGMLMLCVGITMVCFSGIRVGMSPTAATMQPEQNSRLAAIVTEQVQRSFEQQGYIGVVVGAIAKDEEVLLGFGARRLGESQPPDADTVFEIGSITKTFTGILLAQKIESEELELNDRIAELLPQGWSLAESAREVTLRHCTTHTSGIPRLPANLVSFFGAFRHVFGGDPYRDYSEEQFRDALATVELDFEPGTDRNYSNFAVGLLGFVLATQGETDYEKLLTRELCQPLGMHRTVITGDKWLRDKMPEKYRSALKLGPVTCALKSAEWQIPNHLAGAGAIRSTGRDMMTFLKANMGIISTPLDAAIQRSHQELFQEYPGKAMGMNWIRSYEDNISQNIIWHNGGTGGFRTYLGFTEDHQFGVFALSNTAVDVDELAEGILNTLVREYAPESRKPVTEHGYAKVAPYTGVRWQNERPIVQVNGRWFLLASIDDIPIDRIVEFAQRRFGEKARKRFAEDLVELLAIMGHQPQWEVTLGVETSDGQITHLKVVMTEENRSRVRD